MDVDESTAAREAVAAILAAYPQMLGDPEAYDALADRLERGPRPKSKWRMIAGELRARATEMRGRPVST